MLVTDTTILSGDILNINSTRLNVYIRKKCQAIL